MRYSYKIGLQKLTEYALSEGFEEVMFNHKGTSEIRWKAGSLNKPDAICIEGKYTLEIKTYILLHELGHHELRKHWGKFKRILPVTAHVEGSVKSKFKRRKSYQISILEEEFLAWEEGLKLGKSLGIKINMDHWIDAKSKFIKTYITS